MKYIVAIRETRQIFEFNSWINRQSFVKYLIEKNLDYATSEVKNG